MNALPQEARIIVGLFLILFVLASIVWFLWRCLKKSVDATALMVRWVATLVVLGMLGYVAHDLTKDGTAGGRIAAVLAASVFGLALAVLWVPPMVNKASELIGGLYTGGGEAPTPTPAYSVAEARRKQGKPREAIYEIQKQRALFPADRVGQWMMAEIFAEDLGDLRSAEVTIDRIVQQPHAPKNLAFALNSLADWRLKLTRSPEDAREALQRIIDLLPETAEAQNAAQRIAHLPTVDELERRQRDAVVSLGEGAKDLGLRSGVQLHPKDQEDPEQAVARLCGHLAEHPLDRDARETLARLYAEELQQLEAASEQLEALAQLPNQTPRDVAKWINRLADLQILQGAPEDAIRATLQRLVDQFPGLAPAELAQQRLEKVRLEIKGKEKAQSVRLGSYDRDLGLKKAPKSGSV